MSPEEESAIAERAMSAAAEAFGVTVPELNQTHNRRPALNWARQEACWLMRSAGMRLEAIGAAIGYSENNRICAAGKAVGEVNARASIEPIWNKAWSDGHDAACRTFFKDQVAHEAEEASK